MLGFENSKEYSELVRRVFHGDAPAEIVPPGVVLANDRPEWAWARGELLFDSIVTTAALAANFSIAGVAQPSLERVTVIEAVLIRNIDAAAAHAFDVELVSSGTGALSALGTRDMRVTNFTGRAVSGTQVADPFAGGARTIELAANGIFFLAPPRGWVITPNAFGRPNLFVVPDVVNVGVAAHFWGYERRLRPEERFEAA